MKLIDLQEAQYAGGRYVNHVKKEVQHLRDEISRTDEMPERDLKRDIEFSRLEPMIKELTAEYGEPIYWEGSREVEWWFNLGAMMAYKHKIKFFAQIYHVLRTNEVMLYVGVTS